MRRLVLMVLAALAAPAVFAQGEPSSASGAGSSAAMKDLLAKGYEIKTAVPNGSKYIVFLQKDTSAYACEFVTLTNTRCGSVN